MSRDESFDRDVDMKDTTLTLKAPREILEAAAHYWSAVAAAAVGALAGCGTSSLSPNRRTETKKKIQTGLSERVEPRNRPEIDPVDTCLDSQLSVQVIASRIRDSRKFVLGKWIDSK